MAKVYDVCVVGAGMIGSATARHASSYPNTKVCLIGPLEPKDRRSPDCTSQFFGAYYDQARLTRYTSSIPEWAIINARSIPEYRALEKRTGIDFYEETGHLLVDTKNGDYIEKNLSAIKDLGIEGLEQPAPARAREQFPYMHFADDDAMLFESKGSGVLNPRKFVQALQTAAHLSGCDIITDVADDVQSVTQPDGTSLMQVMTAGGAKYLAKRVLIATGAFTEFRSLLPKGFKPNWELATHTVILAEVSDAELEKMRSMPPMCYNGSACRLAMEGKPYDGWGIYLLPPIKYPNGKYYLKLGHHYMPSIHSILTTHEQVVQWFKSRGNPDAVDWLTKVMNNMFPEFKPVAIESDTCVLVHTLDDMHPYIDMLTPSLGVALGGNGMAAKACDQLGKMAAGLVVTGNWQSDLPREAFKFQQRKEQAKL